MRHFVELRSVRASNLAEKKRLFNAKIEKRNNKLKRWQSKSGLSSRLNPVKGLGSAAFG